MKHKKAFAWIAIPFGLYLGWIAIEVDDFREDQESRQNIERGQEFRSGK